MTRTYDVAVVGGGLAGLTAAHHAALDGASVVHIAGQGLPGGLAANIGALEGYPATGPVAAIDLAMQLADSNKALGVAMVEDIAERMEVAGAAKRLHAGGGVYTAPAVIAASGARLRTLDVPGAARLADKGVSQCAWCNGSLHRGQEVVVVGGGDSAVQEALHLTKFASLVTLVVRGEALKARRSLIERAADNPKIAFRWETEVVEVLGEDRVAGVRLREAATGAIEEAACAGVFVYIGLAPNTHWLGEHVALDETGRIVTDEMLGSSLAGLYAIGAVRRGYGGRINQAMGEAATAAMAAARHAQG